MMYDDQATIGQDILDARSLADKWRELVEEDDDGPDRQDIEGFAKACQDDLGYYRSTEEEVGAYFDELGNNEPIFIHDRYFEEYAQQLAEDVGAIDPDASWPACHIDWEAAASSLQMDYSYVDYAGHKYWIRSY